LKPLNREDSSKFRRSIIEDEMQREEFGVSVSTDLKYEITNEKLIRIRNFGNRLPEPRFSDAGRGAAIIITFLRLSDLISAS
jgi:hypothetical protein